MSNSHENPPGAQAVELRELDRENYRAILRLKVAESQRRFVADNAISIAQAHFEPEAWFRGIFAGDEAVGFLMLSDKPEEPEYYLWRMMIAEEHQGKGYGRRAIEQLVEHVRTRPAATELLTSIVEGEGSPQGFYESLGFALTGEYEDGEAMMRLGL